MTIVFERYEGKDEQISTLSISMSPSQIEHRLIRKGRVLHAGCGKTEKEEIARKVHLFKYPFLSSKQEGFLVWVINFWDGYDWYHIDISDLSCLVFIKNQIPKNIKEFMHICRARRICTLAVQPYDQSSIFSQYLLSLLPSPQTLLY